MARRSYDHYCAIARALDAVGDRWSLLVIRELSGGPRRYSDLFADLPGISTDVLAARLRDLEADGVITREATGPRANIFAYQLSEAGHALLPALDALAHWGIRRLGDRRANDALRARWYAPLLASVVAAHVDTGSVVAVTVGGDPPFHLRVNDGTATHHDGEPSVLDAQLRITIEQAHAISVGDTDVETYLTS